MKKGTIISIIALLVSVTGLLIALIAYFKRRSCILCDDLDDDLVEYYEHEDDEDGDACSCCCEESAPEAPAEAEAPAAEADAE